MELNCKWLEKQKKNSNVYVKIKNLQLEGAGFDGRVFVHTTIESSIFITAPTVLISYVDKVKKNFSISLYLSLSLLDTNLIFFSLSLSSNNNRIRLNRSVTKKK